MSDIRAQVILHTVDAVPANFITNTFAFTAATALGSLTSITTAIKDFYDDLSPADISTAVAQNGHEIKYSHLPGTPPNYPFSTAVWNLAGAPAGSPLPSEVAICLSFQGSRQAGFPQARRRGRVYIGPLGTGFNTSGRPGSSPIARLTTAAATMKATLAGLTPAVTWGVWSGRDGAMVPITNGWVDNVFDTQRRRGLVETSRTTFV